ncbi:hypothetical protein FRC11_009232, partial [Ceratobasidium sp. 423]
EPVNAILALLEGVSVYIYNRYETNCLARVASDETQLIGEYDLEAYLSRLEDLQKAFYTSWSSAAASGMDTTYPSAVDDESLELPVQNEQVILDEPTRRA